MPALPRGFEVMNSALTYRRCSHRGQIAGENTSATASRATAVLNPQKVFDYGPQLIYNVLMASAQALRKTACRDELAKVMSVHARPAIVGQFGAGPH
jgi:hypothetical protein